MPPTAAAWILSTLALADPAAGSWVAAGDMLLDPERLASAPAPASPTAATSGLRYYSAKPWPDGRLPIVFSDGIPRERRAAFLSACAEWERAAGVRCVEGSRDAIHLLVLDRPEGGCAATIGYVTGASIQLESAPGWDGCWSRATMLHELGHALGLLHEHQRRDRDDYITILWDNVYPTFRFAYEIIDSGRPELPYDYESIMHYSSFAFWSGTGPTFVVRGDTTSRRAGLATSVSKLDGLAVAINQGWAVAP